MAGLTDKDLIRSASYASVLISSIILIAKIYAWLATGAQSILASLVDSMLDISSSLINLIAVRVSLMPPDDNHRFGHEKFQDLSIFSQSIFFFASSLFALFSSCKALFVGKSIVNHDIGINIMYVCMGLTFVLVSYQNYVVNKTGSRVIAIDKLHYFSDFLTNVAVIVSIYLSSSLWYFDSIVGIAVSIYIMCASYTLFKQSIKNLVDEELPIEDRDKIVKIIGKYKEVKGLHELKTRYAASKPFIQFHLELDGDMSLRKAHEVAEKILEELLKAFPTAEITIHQDPAGVEQDVNYREQI